MKLKVEIRSKGGGRGSDHILASGYMDMDDDCAQVYAERLSDGKDIAKQWLNDQAEAYVTRELVWVSWELEHKVSSEDAA